MENDELKNISSFWLCNFDLGSVEYLLILLNFRILSAY